MRQVPQMRAQRAQKNSAGKMLIIGLTGGIGMGKSTAAAILHGMGYPVHHADRAVHRLLRRGGAGVGPVARVFPEALKGQSIDRKELGRLVFGDAKKLKRLEKILHPLVGTAEKAFIRTARRQKAKAVILEIPLLFEVRADRRCDVTLCVTAPRKIQAARVLGRHGMTRARFEAILKRQMPDHQKRKRADYIIRTGQDKAHTKKQLEDLMKRLVPPLRKKQHAHA